MPNPYDPLFQNDDTLMTQRRTYSSLHPPSLASTETTRAHHRTTTDPPSPPPPLLPDRRRDGGEDEVIAAVTDAIMMKTDEEEYKEEEQDERKIARKKLKDWNFDPDDVSKGGKEWYFSHLRPNNPVINYGERISRPMIIFSQLGDLSMMKYILQNSSSTLESSSDPMNNDELSKTDEYGLFPLYVTITEPRPENRILQLCQWLTDNGANVKQTLNDDWSPLSKACLKGFTQVALWLIKSGALLTCDDTAATSCNYHSKQLLHQKKEHPPRPTKNNPAPPIWFFDLYTAKRDLPFGVEYYDGIDEITRKKASQVHTDIYQWAEDIVSTRNIFFLFLSGTLYHQQATTTTTTTKDVWQKMAKQRLTRMMMSSSSSSPSSSSSSSSSSSFCRRNGLSYDPTTTILFLLGQFQHDDDDKLLEFLEITTCPLHVFNGHPGILSHISQFVGMETDPKILCSARGLVTFHKA